MERREADKEAYVSANVDLFISTVPWQNAWRSQLK